MQGVEVVVGTVTGISGTKPAGEDCVLGAEWFLVEEGMGSFPFVDAVGMPHARL